jgi:uncharacterized membrane protein
MKKQVTVGLLLAVAIVILPSRALAGPTHYFYSPFPALPGDSVGIPLGENNAGQIVGQSQGPGGSSAVLYSHGVLTNLGGPFPTGAAEAINSSGQVVGLAGINPLFHRQEAVSFDAGGVTPLPALPGTVRSVATAINSSGTAFGFASVLGQGPVFTVYQNGGVSALNLPSGSVFYLPPSNTAINDAGQVAGTVSQAAGYRGFVANPTSGSFTLLNPLPGDPESWGLGINGQVQALGCHPSASTRMSASLV